MKHSGHEWQQGKQSRGFHCDPGGARGKTGSSTGHVGKCQLDGRGRGREIVSDSRRETVVLS